MSQVHPSAAQGFSVAAEAYVRGRPEYPEQLLGWLEGEMALGPASACVDLGAGTGKFTKLLVRTGARVVAVEPVAAMRGQLCAGLPGVEALEGTAQAIPMADGSADAVLCAQAFHWFASEEALEEIHRVLKPGGRLGLVWNVRDESVPWVAAMTGILTPYETGSPRFHSGQWRKPFTGRLFSEPAETVFPHGHAGRPRDVIVERSLSVSFIASLPEAERARVEQRLLDLIAATPELRDRETVTVPYRTRAFRCDRR